MGSCVTNRVTAVPVECAGVTVRPGDIIVADEDGVVVVPHDQAAPVIKEAQAIDDRKRGMYPFIREFKSLQKAIARFNRIRSRGDRPTNPRFT